MGEWISIVVPIESPMIVSIIHSPIPYEEPDRLRSGFQLEYARQWRGEKRKASSVIEATSSYTLRAAQKFTYNNLELSESSGC